MQNGRPDKGMPKFDLSKEDIASIAAFIHSMPVGGRAATTGTVNPLVGDAKAGEAYFNGAGKCATCHSVTGDLRRHRRTDITDVRALQGAMLSGERQRRVCRRFPTKQSPLRSGTGRRWKARLYQIDDFIVSLDRCQW